MITNFNRYSTFKDFNLIIFILCNIVILDVSNCVAVFLAKEYMENVAIYTDNDNCKLEYAARKKRYIYVYKRLSRTLTHRV